jgi:hypothetical protein
MIMARGSRATRSTSGRLAVVTAYVPFAVPKKFNDY